MESRHKNVCKTSHKNTLKYSWNINKNASKIVQKYVSNLLEIIY